MRRGQIEDFSESLLIDGKVRVQANAEVDSKTLDATRVLLLDFEQEYRRSLPAGMPAFDVDVALCATQAVYRLCQAIAFPRKEHVPDTTGLAENALSEFSARASIRSRSIDDVSLVTTDTSTIYSADIVLRLLVDIERLALKSLRCEEIQPELRRLGTAFPLSAVGMVDYEPTDATIERLCAHQELGQLFIERIVQRKDNKLYQHPAVRHLAKTYWGMYSEDAESGSDAAHLQNSSRTVTKPE